MQKVSQTAFLQSKKQIIFSLAGRKVSSLKARIDSGGGGISSWNIIYIGEESIFLLKCVLRMEQLGMQILLNKQN